MSPFKLITTIGEHLGGESPVHLCVVDASLTIHYCSAPAFGWSPRDVIGAPLLSRVIERDQAAAHKGLRAAERGAVAKFRCRVIGPEGAGVLTCAAMPLTRTKILAVAQIEDASPKLSLADKIEHAVLAVLAPLRHRVSFGMLQELLQNQQIDASTSTMRHILARMVRRRLLHSQRGDNGGYQVLRGSD